MNRRTRRLSRILDECLERIRAGRSSVDDCLRMYPDDADQLAPMLALAIEARTRFAPGGPRPEYVAASRRRIEAILSLRQLQAQYQPRRDNPVRRWRPAQAFISLVLALAVLAVGTGAVQAAGGALPGDPLYFLKRGIERARLVVTWNASGHAVLLAQHADERLSEVEDLLNAKRYDDIDLALDGLEDTLSGISNLAGEGGNVIDPGLLAHILDRLSHHQEVLQRVRDQVPAEAQSAIDLALERSSHSLEVMLQLSQGGSPSDLAPGRQRTPTSEPPETPTMHVIDLDAHRTGDQVRVDVEVALSNGSKASGATVTGSWSESGPAVEFMCITTGSGKCHLQSGDVPESTEVTFTIISISHPALSYAPEDNADSDGDSNGTTISIDLTAIESPTATPTVVSPTATPTGEPPTQWVYVYEIKITNISGEARVTIQVGTDGGLLLPNAFVTGTWTLSGTGVENSCGPTLASGKCPIYSGEITGQTFFTVTGITLPGYSYAPWKNLTSTVSIIVP